MNSDLAYGKGYVEKRRSREFSPPNSPGRPSLSRRAQTDEDILELGRKFAEIARQQNAEDLRIAGRNRPSTLTSAASALTQFRRSNSGNSNRGVGSSKPHRDSSPDDSEWESASDDDSESSEFESGLAYGSGLSLPSTSGPPARALGSPRSLLVPNHDPPLHRKRSLVDPNLFGPVNSLRGYVEAPCGFEKVDRSQFVDSRQPHGPLSPPSEALSESRSMQRVYPVPTSDPSRFDVARGSVVSAQQDLPTPSRPAPIPLQQPKPIAPVSRKVLDSVEDESRYSDRSLSRKALGETAAAGVVGTVLGAALSSDRGDDRDKQEGRRDRDGKRRSRRSDAGLQDERGEKRRNREELREARDDRPERRREKRPEPDRNSEIGRAQPEVMVSEAGRESRKERRRRDKPLNNDYGYDRERDKRNERSSNREIDRSEIRKDEHHNEDRAGRSDLESENHKRLEGAGRPPREGPVDVFQFQVADDAFQTPLYTTPKRPLTPNVVTVDREPNFSRFEQSDDHVHPPERLSRKDSYEREIRDARDVYEAAEHATAPVSEAAFAAATAAVLAEDRRGRSRSRGSDASSTNRSRRDESPKHERDAVQENANRYYREAELARRIKEQERRSTNDTESSVIDKWKQNKGPVTVNIVSPPEMDHPKKKSPYDGPNADVRIDNVLEHPSELVRFRMPDTRGLTGTSIFRTRDPSAERERPMLNVVRPTPVHSPTPEEQLPVEESQSGPARRAGSATDQTPPDVVIGPRGEIVPAPPTPKAVSWGENQTKHYVVESPEREDDPYSGVKIVTPAKTPKSRSGKKSGWGIIAAAVSGANDAAASSSVSDSTMDDEAKRTRRATRDREVPTNSRSSAQLDDMYDSPPVPGPKPTSPRSAQMPGGFAEDPLFTANIAAALQGSGFDPNIVIDNASFHRRDSPPSSNDPVGYRSPFVNSVTDLGVVDISGPTISQNDQEHGFVIGEVPETPSDEKDIITDKSEILSKLKQLRATKQDSPGRSEAIDNGKSVDNSRSVAEDDWNLPSSKLSKKERKRRDKAAKAQPTDDDLPIDDASQIEQDLEAEFLGAAAAGEEDTSSKKKKPKKSKKAIVVQDNSKQPDSRENPMIIVPVDTFQDVQDAKTVKSESGWDLPTESRRPKRDPEGYGSRTAPASELSTESSYRVIDADSAPSTGEEWETPKKSRLLSRRDAGSYDSPPRSAQTSEISLELARRTTLPDTTSRSGDEYDVSKKNKKSKRGSIDEEFSSSVVHSIDDESMSEKSKERSERESGSYGSPRVESSSVDIVESPKEMDESFGNLRSEKTAATEDEWDMTPKKSKKKSKSRDTPSTPVSQSAPSEASVGSAKKAKQDFYPDSPSRSTPASEVGTDDTRKKSKKKKRRSTGSFPSDANLDEGEPPDIGRDRFEALDRDVSSVVSDPSRYDDHKSSRSRARGENLDDTMSVASAPGSADRKDRKSSKSEKDTRISGSSSFFDRFKSSIGIAEEKGRQRKAEEDKKNSFLDNAGTLGTGVGSTGADIAPVSQESRSNATNASLEEETQTVPFTPERQSTQPQEAEFIDPEIVPREIRPAIDPKYGDLLPLPPSLPGSPVPELGDGFPPLPDSRPETPEHERHLREMPTHARRRSGFETPHRPKTPSQSAIPLQFLLGGHKATATPESPINVRSPSVTVRSPSASPITATPEFGSGHRRRPRPTSWEGSREFKPLLLLQRAFRESVGYQGSSDRESSPSEKLQDVSLSKFDAREDDSQPTLYAPTESLSLDSQLREDIFQTLVQSNTERPVEPSEVTPTANMTFKPLDEGVLNESSNEYLRQQRNEVADIAHLEPLPESIDLPLMDKQPADTEEHGVNRVQESSEHLLLEPTRSTELTLEKPELSLIVPNPDTYTIPLVAQESSNAEIPTSSPSIVPVQEYMGVGAAMEDSLGDNFKDVTTLAKTATLATGDAEVMPMLSDRNLSYEDESAGHLATLSKDVRTPDVLKAEDVTSPDVLGVGDGSARDHRLVELSSSDKPRDGDIVKQEKPGEAKDLAEVSTIVEAHSAQEEPLSSDNIIEQVPVTKQIQGYALEETSTKEMIQVADQDVDNNKPAEVLENGGDSLAKEVQKEAIETSQPEPETSNAQQNASASSKKGKKKKKKGKSQATVPSLDEIFAETRDVKLEEAPMQPREDTAVAENTPAVAVRELSTVEEEPPAIAESTAAAGHVFTINEEPTDEEKPAVEERPIAFEEPATVEQESNSEEKPTTEEEPTIAEIETFVTEPVAEEPSGSAWSFWGVTKKGTKKPKEEEPPAKEVDSNEGWLDWGKKKLKGPASAPVEDKKEPELTAVGPASNTPEQDTSTVKFETPVALSETSATAPGISPVEPEHIAVEPDTDVLQSEPFLTEAEPTIVEPAASTFGAEQATIGTGAKEIPTIKPEVPLAEIEHMATELETSTIEQGLPTLQSKTDLVPSAIESVNTITETEQAAVELDTKKPPVVEPETNAVKVKTTVMEPEVQEQPALERESTVTEKGTPSVEAELLPTELESATVKNEPVIAEEKPEQHAPSAEPSQSVSKKGKKKKKSKIQPSLENELSEPTTSLEQSTKPTEESIQEDNAKTPDVLLVEPQTLGQDQLEAAISQESPDIQLNLPEEPPSTPKKSKKKKKGKKTQVLEPTPETEATVGQTSTQGHESQPLPEQVPSLPAVEEAEMGIQADSVIEGPTEEASVDHKEAELQLIKDNSINGEAPSDEPLGVVETRRDREELPREIRSPNGLAESLSTGLKTDDPIVAQPALSSDPKQEQQSHSTSELVLGEDQSRSDTDQPENLVATSVVLENPDSEQEHDGQPTSTEASLQAPVAHEPSGSKSLEHTNVDDESLLQPNVLSGVDSREEDPASTDPLEAPLSEAISTEKLHDNSAGQQTEAVEAPAALNVVTDNIQSSNAPNESIADALGEMAVPIEDPGSKHKGKKNRNKHQDTTEAVEPSIASETAQEPAPQVTESEANVGEPLVSDVLEKPAQESAEVAGDDPWYEPTSAGSNSKAGENNLQDPGMIVPGNGPEAPKAEEPSIEPQLDAEIVQEPVLEQAKPIGNDALPEADSSSKKSKKKGKKKRQSTDASEPSKSVEEPAIVDTVVVDNNQSIEEPVVVSASEINVPAGEQLEKDQTLEAEFLPINKKSKKGKKKPSSAQIEPDTAEESTQQPLGNSIIPDNANSEATLQIEPIIDVDTVGGDKQVTPTQEEAEDSKPTTKRSKKGKKRQSQSYNDAEETPASIAAPEVSIEPSLVPEEIAQATKETYDSAPPATSTETPLDDKEIKHQSVQFAEPLEQNTMEFPVDSNVAFPESKSDTIFDTNWGTAEIPPPPDFWSQPEDYPDNLSRNVDDSLKTEHHSSEYPPVDPLDQLLKDIEAKKQADALANDENKPGSPDTNISPIPEEPSVLKNTKDPSNSRVDERRDLGSTEASPKDELDTAQQSSGEVAPNEEQNAEEQKPAERVIVQQPITQDDSQIALGPTNPATLRTEAEAVEGSQSQSQGRIAQAVGKETEDNKSLLVEPTISKYTEPKDPAEPLDLSDSQPQPTFSTQDATSVTAEESSVITKKSKKDKKKRKSKSQDTFDPPSEIVTPAEGPSTHATLSEQIEPPSTISQDQIESVQVALDTPTTTEPELLALQPLEDEPQDSVTKKSKKDKKKKKRASQIQESESSPMPTEETTVERPQSPTHDSNEFLTVESSHLPLLDGSESLQPATEKILFDQHTAPAPGTSETTAESTDALAPAPQQSAFADVSVLPQDFEQERASQIEETGGDTPTVEAKPETVLTSESTESQEQKETSQTVHITEGTIPEQESIVEQAVLDERPEAVVTPKSKKDKKKKKKRDSQASPDDTDPKFAQDVSEYASSIPTPAEEAIKDGTDLVAIEEASASVLDAEPKVEANEPTENIAPAVSQDVTESAPVIRPTTEVKDYVETSSTPAEPLPGLLATSTPVDDVLDIQTSKKGLTEESNKDEENKQAVLQVDETSQQDPELQAKDIHTTLIPNEQTETDVTVALGASVDEGLTDDVPLKNIKKGKKNKEIGLRDDGVLQVEPAYIPIETTRDTEQIEADTPAPGDNLKDNDITNLGMAEQRSSALDDAQAQEGPGEVDVEATATPDVGEPLEPAPLLPESSKDEYVDEVLSTKKSKKSKKKKRASVQETDPAQQEVPAQIADDLPKDDLATSVSAAKQIDAEEPLIPESLKDQDTLDFSPSKKSKKDKKKKKKAGTLESEPEPQPSIEAEPDATSQLIGMSAEISHLETVTINTEDTVLVEESVPTGPSENPIVSPNNNEVPVVSTQDKASLPKEGLSTVQSAEIVEGQVVKGPSPDSFPTEDLAIALATSDHTTAGATRPEVASQALEENKDTITSLSLNEEHVSQTEEPAQPIKTSNDFPRTLTSEEQALQLVEPAELEGLAREQELPNPEEYIQLKEQESSGPEEVAKVQETTPPEEPVQTESTQAEEPPRSRETPPLAEPTQVEEAQQEVTEQITDSPKADQPVQLEEFPNPEEVAKPGETAQPGEQTQLTEEPLVTLDGPEIVSAKKSRKYKKNKRTSQVEPGPSSESVQQVEEVPTQTALLPEQPAKQDVLKELVDFTEKVPAVDDPTSPKDGGNIEDTSSGVGTSKKSKKKKKRASQLEPGPEPKRESPPSEELAVQSSLPEPSQEPEQLDSQIAAEVIPTVTTDSVNPEDAFPEISSSKKSKKNKKRVSQVQERETDTATPSELKAESSPVTESSVQEPTEQASSQPKVEEPIATREEEISEDVVPSKKSKKEKRKAKKLVVSAAEAEAEGDLKIEDVPAGTSVEPSHTEQHTEPVNPILETETLPSAGTPPADLQVGYQQPSTIEMEPSTRLDQDLKVDSAEKESFDREQALLPSPERDLTTPAQVEDVTNDTPLEIIANTTAEAAQESVDDPIVHSGDLEKDEKEAQGLDVPGLAIEVPNPDIQSQDIRNPEKQDEVGFGWEPAVTEQPDQVKPDDLPEPDKIPETNSAERREQIPVDQQVNLDESLSREPGPELSAVTRKKSKKDKKKKRASAQSELEPSSEIQKPSTPVSIGGDLNETNTSEPMIPEPERTIANDGEWPESPRKSNENKKRRKASGTSTPLESMEDAPADAPPETITEENAPGNPTLEEISDVEGQSSKAKDVQEETFSKPSDQDVNAEDINSSHPTKEDVIVPEDHHQAPPAEEEQLVQPDEVPTNETAQDISDHAQLSMPISPPRTPEPTAPPPAINVDLSPAQPISHVEHERPFDESPQPGKKARTRLSSDNTMIPEPLSAQPDVPPQIFEKLLHPIAHNVTGAEYSIATPEDITHARGVAASYLESQQISTRDALTTGLLPAFTPRREIAASYFEGRSASEPKTDVNRVEDISQEPRNAVPTTTIPGDVSTSHPDEQLSQPESGHVEENTRPFQYNEARQPSPIKDTAPSAREVAATLMESHSKSMTKEKRMTKDTEPMATEILPVAVPTGGAILSPEKLSGSKGSKKGKKKQTENQTGAPASDPMETEPSKNLLEPRAGQDEAAENLDIESPVVGRTVQHDLPKPRNDGHESPELREPPTSEIIEKLDDLDTSEYLNEPRESTEKRKIDDGILKSISPTRSYMSSGRASPRVLPPVKEETHEDIEKEQPKPGRGDRDKVTSTAEANRDSGSGLIANSPKPMRRSLAGDAGQRDSGVHLHDWPESETKNQEEPLHEDRGTVQTPRPNEKRTKKLGLGSETPKLETPRTRDQGDKVQSTTDPKKTRPATYQDVVSQRSVSDNISRRSTPLAERQLRRSASNTSISRMRTPEPLRFRPESPGINPNPNLRSGGTTSSTPPLSLRRVDKRMSGDLRSLSSNLSNNNNGSRENLHQFSSSTTPVANEGRVRAKDMTDVYDGYGEGRIGSPRSPTRPHSMRRRQSMQVLELESRVDQLVAENRALSDAKSQAELNLNQQAVSAITERDAEIESLKASLEWLRKEVTRLTEVNEGLNSANNVLALQHREKYGHLESQHASASKELEEHRFARGQYTQTLQEKDAEIQELRAQLEATKEQVREMQRQILASKPPDADFLRLKDEDYFDHRCQQLCSHVQQWVLRFSKFSDMRACRLTNDINDEKIIDRLDNSILDGSDVDEYLRDRVKRRDIFMSMTMNMIWEFVFTRYLFGMDREQRQKLKSLEKLLTDVGPPHAVRQWRAVTLTLLSKRPAFGDQRNQDTEAVVQAVFQTLCMILPPPSNLEGQIQSQLRRVMREAVDLSIEMRTQRAEYHMLPPLQPEYDANGDLARTVNFNASLMNERSSDAVSNDEYEAQGAIVRTVLFPLVVKKGNDNGVGDDEIVICPAQVLVAKPRHSAMRMMTPVSEGGVPLSRGATPSVSVPGQSVVSLQMQDAPPPQPTPPHESDYI